MNGGVACKCCGEAGNAGINVNGHCPPCARGQHTQTCRTEEKAVAAKKKGAPAVAPPPLGPAKPAAPAAPPPQATAAAPEPTPAPPAPVEAPAPSQAAAEVVVLAAPVPPAGETTAVARPRVAAGSSGLELRTMDDYVRFSVAVAKSAMVKGFDTPEKVLVAVQFGAEVGLSPMQSLQSVGVINGRAALHTDAPLAIVRASGLLEDFDEWFEHDGQRTPRWPSDPKAETAAFCLVKRKGERELVSSFSVADAKLAGLWGKDGPWKSYPGRMMKFRARSFGLRDTFADKLKGFRDVEETADIIDVTTTEIPLPRAKGESV